MSVIHLCAFILQHMFEPRQELSQHPQQSLCRGHLAHVCQLVDVTLQAGDTSLIKATKHLIVKKKTHKMMLWLSCSYCTHKERDII